MGDDRDDTDRDAILARRRVLIALALSGLTSAAACGDVHPLACLEPVPPTEQTSPAQVTGETAPADVEDQISPISPVADPVPCLEVVRPEDEGAGGSDEPSEDVRPAPRPCLSRPTACLSVRPHVAPRPCLSVSPHVAPRPCLR